MCTVSTLLTIALPVAFVAFVTAAYRLGWQWTGLAREQPWPAANGRPAKTLWDWLQLLIIPAGLALVLLALSSAQAHRENQREADRSAHAAKYAQDRAEQAAAHARAATTERVRADALRGYMHQMSGLLLNKGLRRSNAKASVRALATTLTLTLVPQLDGARKGRVLRFLAGAGLIRAEDPPVDLSGADLRGLVAPGGADIESMSVRYADLSGADFSRFGSRIGTADFSGSDLRGANLTGLKVQADAAFDLADLRDANFTDVEFDESSRFASACVTGVTFDHARMRDTSFYGARGIRVSFRGAHLKRASLRDNEAAVFRGQGCPGAARSD